MQLKLFNTLTRKVEPFSPSQPDGVVRLYTCGPTVYNYAHIGNLRAYVFSDVLRRALHFNGLEVRQVMNITDVGHMTTDADEGEDKMVAGARRERRSPEELADMYSEAFFCDLERLNILSPDIVCRATDHIDEMIELTARLLEMGYAYEISDGVYFDVQKFAEYGQLSGLDLEGQEAGARIGVNEEKRHPADFALWRKANPNHLMQWDSPWGRGYPGWHIECSAMGIKYLGTHIDIHTGGIDHVPVHHENEIAQADCLCGHQVVKRWMHNEFLLVDGGRMSKSLDNFYTLSTLQERGFHPLSYRYFCLNAHYRSKLNFTWETLAGAEKALQRLWKRAHLMVQGEGDGDEEVSSYREKFATAVNDDLGLPQGLAVLWEVIRSSDITGATARELLEEFDEVLGLGLKAAMSGEHETLTAEIPQAVQEMVKARDEARAQKDWSTADAIREQLHDLGYEVTDTPEGTKVKK